MGTAPQADHRRPKLSHKHIILNSRTPSHASLDKQHIKNTQAITQAFFNKLFAYLKLGSNNPENTGLLLNCVLLTPFRQGTSHRRKV